MKDMLLIPSGPQNIEDAIHEQTIDIADIREKILEFLDLLEFNITFPENQRARIMKYVQEIRMNINPHVAVLAITQEWQTGSSLPLRQAQRFINHGIDRSLQRMQAYVEMAGSEDLRHLLQKYQDVKKHILHTASEQDKLPERFEPDYQI